MTMRTSTPSSKPPPDGAGRAVRRTRGQRMPRTARRAQLLAAAQEAFVECGYHAAAMDDIADRAGVSKPVLYQHFPGKMELYLALLDQRAEELEQAVRGGVESSSHNKARVYATVEAYFGFVAREGSAFRLLFESDLINDPTVSQRIDRAFRRCGEAFADAIAEGAAVSKPDAMLLAMALTGMAQMAARNWAVLDSSVDQTDAVTLVSRLAWRGLAGFPQHADPAPA